MSPEYPSEVFRLSYCRHNTRASTLVLDVHIWKYKDQEHGKRYQLK